MIFVTVGNHFQGFDRLLRKMDEIALRMVDEVVIQKGYSTYDPKHARYFDFVPMGVSIEHIKNSNLVISHAGIGTIILCKEHGIPLIIFPRRKKYGEHSNDHQMEIAGALEKRGDANIYVVYKADLLEEKIADVFHRQGTHSPSDCGSRKRLIRTIEEFINQTS
jgi:UDP-N-acetylglucosamine transferase subunit ALG13